MRLLAPAGLNERLRKRGDDLASRARAVADAASDVRHHLARYHLVIAVVAGGVAGAALATRWSSFRRFTTSVTSMIMRAALVSLVQWSVDKSFAIARCVASSSQKRSTRTRSQPAPTGQSPHSKAL